MLESHFLACFSSSDTCAHFVMLLLFVAAKGGHKLLVCAGVLPIFARYVLHFVLWSVSSTLQRERKVLVELWFCFPSCAHIMSFGSVAFIVWAVMCWFLVFCVEKKQNKNKNNQSKHLIGLFALCKKKKGPLLCFDSTRKRVQRNQNSVLRVLTARDHWWTGDFKLGLFLFCFIADSSLFFFCVAVVVAHFCLLLDQLVPQGHKLI